MNGLGESSDTLAALDRLVRAGRLWVDINGTWLAPSVSEEGGHIVLSIGDDDLDEND